MDAIDNSAGVDCSDHEVNIKILLDNIVASGDMTEKQRNELLVEMTDEVERLVLRDNYDQTLAISNALALAHPMVDVHVRYIRHLEQSGALNRELEVLPSDETLSERRSEGGGLTAPEFAILLSYTKITLYKQLLESDLPEDNYLSAELARYFPTPLRERFGDRMEEHRLRREIVATRVANELVNRAGPSFAFRLGEETGASPAGISRAFTAAVEVFDMRETWESIEGLDDEVDARVQTEMLLAWRRLVERSTRWLLRNRRPPLDISATVSYFRNEAPNLASSIHDFMIDGEKKAVDEAAARLIERGVPEGLAHRVSTFSAMFSALDVVDVAVAAGERPETAAEVYFALGDRLRIHWLRHHVESLPRDNRWRALARAALRDDVYGLQAAMTAAVLRDTPEDEPVPGRIEAWAGRNEGAVARALHVLSDINASGAFDLATLSVGLREVRNLVPSATV
jgi:glutamate dehydrogenase